MTASDGHPAGRDDHNASVRAELLGQIAAAQFDLEAVIADLTRDGAPASALIESRSQLGALTALSRQMAGASTATLATMRAEIASVVATSQSAAQQARTAAAATPDAAELIHRAEEARAHVNEVMRGMKDFDPYLKFADEREQVEYRRREAERSACIAAQQAKGAPEGNLNASGAAVGQMADAAAHGAGDSPEFRQRWDGLIDSTRKLREQVVRNGGDVSKFDADVRADLHRILKSKGMSDAQIEAQRAAHPEMLDAMHAIVSEQKVSLSQQEIGDLAVRTDEHKEGAVMAVSEVRAEAVAAPAKQPGSLADAMSVLKAAGVAPVAQDAEAPPAHGVTTKITAIVTSARVV